MPESEICGWVGDCYDLSRQIVPRQLIKLLYDKDKDRAKRAFDALMKMKRNDIAAIARAADAAAQ